MISGDCVGTAQACALEAGIVTEAEVKKQYTVMHAKDFRKLVGKVVPHPENEDEQVVENIKNFKTVITKLRVLARATPEDKHTIVVGLKEIGQTVAVTGDGANDAKALKTADVGIAMGKEGCEVAKDAADVILKDDSFGNVVTFIMQGKNLFFNVRKFLVYQITANLSCVGIIVLGAVIFGESPFTPPQLLFINLIMDTLGAIALASEPVHPLIIKDPHVLETDNIITRVMWRQIVCIAVYQMLTMVFIFSFGFLIFDIDFVYLQPRYEDGQFTGKGKLYTIMFYTFVFMQLFN